MPVFCTDHPDGRAICEPLLKPGWTYRRLRTEIAGTVEVEAPADNYQYCFSLLDGFDADDLVMFDLENDTYVRAAAGDPDDCKKLDEFHLACRNHRDDVLYARYPGPELPHWVGEPASGGRPSTVGSWVAEESYPHDRNVARARWVSQMRYHRPWRTGLDVVTPSVYCEYDPSDPVAMAQCMAKNTALLQLVQVHCEGMPCIGITSDAVAGKNDTYVMTPREWWDSQGFPCLLHAMSRPRDVYLLSGIGVWTMGMTFAGIPMEERIAGLVAMLPEAPA